MKNACEKFARELAEKIGANVWLSDGWIFFSVHFFGKDYQSFRGDWGEIASALAVIADVKSAVLGESEEPDDFDPAFRDWANAEYDSDSGSAID